MQQSSTHPPVMACLKLDLNVVFNASLAEELGRICKRARVDKDSLYALSQ